MASRSRHGKPSSDLPAHLDPRRRRSATWTSRTPRRVVMALTAALSIGLFAVSGYAWATFRNIDNGINRVTLSGPTPVSSANPPGVAGTAQNIMLVGIDDRTNMTDAEVRALKVGRDGGSMATDTMMIVHVPADGSRATIISLPRDSWVHIPGVGWHRLNSAYADGYLEPSRDVWRLHSLEG